jgi:hypothetical protein
VSSAPSSASPNCFNILCNKSDNIPLASTETIDAPPNPDDQPVIPTPPPAEPVTRPQPAGLAVHPPHKSAWEHKLPKCYTVAVTSGANSLHLPLEIESADNAVKLSLDGLVDCRATSDFIDSKYVKATGIPVHRLSQPIPVFNVDGSPNEAGFI